MKIEGDEIWVPIKFIGFEETHEISNLGRVRSFYITNKHKDVPYIIKPYICNNLVVCRCLNAGGIKVAYVANEVLKAFGQERPIGCSIMYLDGDKTNCRFSNLKFGNKRAGVAQDISGRSCKKCIFYKCFPEQDDGVHFNIDYALEGCFKYVEKE